MALTDFPELRKLTNSQKLKLADVLWLAAVEDSKVLRVAHRRLVDSRWRSYRSGKAGRISMEELEARVSRR